MTRNRPIPGYREAGQNMAARLGRNLKDPDRADRVLKRFSFQEDDQPQPSGDHRAQGNPRRPEGRAR